MEHHFEVSWSISCVPSNYWWGYWQICSHTNVSRSRSGGEQWFDASCCTAYDTKQTAYRAWCRTRNAEHWGQFALARAVTQRFYGAARESHNDHTRNTLKHFTCSHKWWETQKCSIFGMKPCIPALRGSGGGLAEAPAEKDSLLGSQFDSNQCREQFRQSFVLFSLV